MWDEAGLGELGLMLRLECGEAEVLWRPQKHPVGSLDCGTLRDVRAEGGGRSVSCTQGVSMLGEDAAG